MATIKNNGTTDLNIVEFITKATTLSPGATLPVDPDTKRIVIGDVEIDLT